MLDLHINYLLSNISSLWKTSPRMLASAIVPWRISLASSGGGFDPIGPTPKMSRFMKRDIFSISVLCTSKTSHSWKTFCFMIGDFMSKSGTYMFVVALTNRFWNLFRARAPMRDDRSEMSCMQGLYCCPSESLPIPVDLQGTARWVIRL